ncbi:GntR family transcriptional regulator [Devosia beringensis]|uniref:GntR family transcriptional regulator n=1 Tax=Devosia beringensis TaxID=2657486 RepID=UPI00186B6F18|nr:GntR family transcriptional regulator [Devosia beringensis]
MDDLRTLFQADAESLAAAPGGEAVQAPQLVRERVFVLVRNAIVDGRLAPGTRLTERELCEAFGISRTVVREIARRLEAEKLATVIPHRGLTVATLTRKHVQEIYEIRTELEAIAVRSFLNAATDAHIAQAQAFGAQLLDAGKRGDKVRLVETMARFNHFMSEVADNQVVTEVLDQLSTRINRLRVMAMAEPGQLETGMEGVRAIIAGITARDLTAAESAVRVYVRRSGEAVLRHMDGDH